MRKLKVLHVQLTDNFGGIESLLLNVYSKIDRSTFHFDFIANGKASYQPKLKELGAKIYIMPSLKHIIAYKRKFLEILDCNYDIVHFHKNSAANILPILWAKHHYTHPKIIVHSHNSAPSINNKCLFLLHKANRHLLDNLADKKIACSELAAKWMFGNDMNVNIIYNGVDLSRFSYSYLARKKIRENYNLKPNTLVIGNVGRFSEQKNQIFLINIFYHILKRNKDSCLLLIGTGHLETILKNRAKELGIKDKVLFLGNKGNVQDYLSAMDIYVAPSLYEGLSVSLIEAQAEGLRLFLSDKISSETIVTNLISSFKLDTPVVQVANYILENKEISKKRSEYSKMLQASLFNINSTINSIEKVYWKAIYD